MDKVAIRELTDKDISAILEIDRRITGRPSPSYWKDKAQAYLHQSGSTCLAAEVNGQLVGFVLGEIRGWEFGIPLSGWLEVVGVDPDHQGKGIGRQLVEALCQRFLEAGVDRVHTMVNWNDGDLVSYFISCGFVRGDFILLGKKLKG